MKPTRIFLADDHILVRAGIRSLLEKLPNVNVVDEASDGAEVMTRLALSGADVLLADIAMHGMSGLALAAEVQRDFPRVKVLILSMHANEEYVVQALRAGVAGYLLKDAVVTELARALECIARGEVYLSPVISRRVLDAYLARTTGKLPPPDPLTPRQRETLRLIAEGKNTKEIAEILGLSVKTVETHRAQLMERLEIRDVAGLVRYALRTGISA